MRNRQISEIKDNAWKLEARVDALLDEFKEYCKLTGII